VTALNLSDLQAAVPLQVTTFTLIDYGFWLCCELSQVKKKLVLDPVILNQKKSGFLHRIQNLCKAQAFDSVTEFLSS